MYTNVYALWKPLQKSSFEDVNSFYVHVHVCTYLQVVNFMSTDTDRIVNFGISFHMFWSLPFQIVVALVLLYLQVSYTISTTIHLHDIDNYIGCEFLLCTFYIIHVEKTCGTQICRLLENPQKN